MLQLGSLTTVPCPLYSCHNTPGIEPSQWRIFPQPGRWFVGNIPRFELPELTRIEQYQNAAAPRTRRSSRPASEGHLAGQKERGPVASIMRDRSPFGCLCFTCTIDPAGGFPARSFHEEHPPGLLECACRKPVEINAGGQSLTMVPPAVPLDRVIARSLVFTDQCSDLPPSQVEDLQ